jgi:tetratricopeptide (TPR) repeat protein
VVLALAYAAFLITVATYLVRGLMRTEGDARLLLGGLGGAWTAYLVSSTVSIDQVPMLTLEFVTAGAIVALSGATVRQIRLPGALREPVAGPARRGRKMPTVRVRETTPADLAWTTAAALGLLVLTWFSLLPLRANAAVRHGDIALAQGRGNEALTAYQHANGLLSGVGVYWEKTGFLLESVHHNELALPQYRRGIQHDPYDVALVTNAARLADGANLPAEAARLWKRALVLDPTNPLTVIHAAGFQTAHGHPELALALLARPLHVLPNDDGLWAATGQAREASGDTAGAVRAYRKAVELNANNAISNERLQKLAGAT